MPDLLATDGLTYALGFAAAVAFLVHTYLTPQSLVHPILLGRQSDVERVRQKGESAVYRNYGTGLMGRLPLRPDNAVLRVWDLVKADFTGTRYLYGNKITNNELKSRASALASGLVQVAGLRPKESNVLLLTDGFSFLLADLALASQGMTSFTISKLSLLSNVLEKHPPTAIIVNINLAHEVLELIMDDDDFKHHVLILVGEGELPKDIEKAQVQIHWLSNLEREGSKKGSLEPVAVEPDTIFSIAFYPKLNGNLTATQISHQNMTAGVAASRAMFPLNGAITPNDSIISAFPPTSPYGRAVLYTALYEGASFTPCIPTVEDSKKDPIEQVAKIAAIQPSATVAFVTHRHLVYMMSTIRTRARRSWLFSIARRHKLFHIQNGFLSNDSIWDRLVFAGPRKTVLQNMANTLRCVVMSTGTLPADILDDVHIALSIPFVNTHTHPLVAGPVFFTHPLDLQSFPIDAAVADTDEFSTIAPAGAPSINLEVKLLNVDDEVIEGGANPRGEIAIRGPSVTLPLGGEAKPHDWVHIRDRGMVQPNGTFKVVPIPA